MTERPCAPAYASKDTIHEPRHQSNLTEADAREQCSTRSIGISAIETLPDGGVRLVCMSSEGAALLRRRLKSQIISDSGTTYRQFDSPPALVALGNH